MSSFSLIGAQDAQGVGIAIALSSFCGHIVSVFGLVLYISWVVSLSEFDFLVGSCS